MKGLPALLTVLFVGLKLTNYIDWSWWLVTLPFWFGIAMTMVLAFLVGLFLIIPKQRSTILKNNK